MRQLTAIGVVLLLLAGCGEPTPVADTPTTSSSIAPTTTTAATTTTSPATTSTTTTSAPAAETTSTTKQPGRVARALSAISDTWDEVKEAWDEADTTTAGEPEVTTTIGEPEETTTTGLSTTPSTTADTAPDRPDWCIYDDRIQTEYARSTLLFAEHGEGGEDWPEEALDRLTRSNERRATAADQLWEEAPAEYNWDDIARACGRSVTWPTFGVRDLHWLDPTSVTGVGTERVILDINSDGLGCEIDASFANNVTAEGIPGVFQVQVVDPFQEVWFLFRDTADLVLGEPSERFIEAGAVIEQMFERGRGHVKLLVEAEPRSVWSIGAICRRQAPDNPGDSVDCSDFATPAEAQAWYLFYRPLYGDPALLDEDGDGQVCGFDYG